jgi:predicted glycosyltransferase
MANIFFYSTDFPGMGHFTRTDRIADFLAGICKKDNFIIITNKYIIKRNLPKNLKILLLPYIQIKKKPKNIRFVYCPEIVDKLQPWIKFVTKKIYNYAPKVFYSDLSPSGGYGELKHIFPILKKLKIKTIIGLRDILDSPSRTKREWVNNNIISIYDYDRILVYGNNVQFKKLYDSILLSKSKMFFPGYIFPKKYSSFSKKTIDILALFGGGGNSIDQIYYIARLLNRFQDKKIIIVTGPLFSKQIHKVIKSRYKHIRFVKSANNVPSFISMSRLIISHGGYNTSLEALINSKQVLLFPRHIVRKEQIYRAKYFKKMGFCDYIDSRNSEKVNVEKINRALIEKRLNHIRLEQGLHNNLKKLFWLN